MTNTDFHARRTELSNAFAAAGAELLDYMRCAGALAAIPNTQQYVVAGDIAAIRAQLDTVAPQRRMRHGDRPEQPLYFGPEAGQARRWAALITSAGHGILQEYGTPFEHAQPGQEVLEVMEILPGPATANKAAEEGELPEYVVSELARVAPPPGVYYLKADVDGLLASRQVANKAEVDLSMQEVADAIGAANLMRPDEFRRFLNGDDVVMTATQVWKMCRAFAAPPATTGASTAPTDDEIMSKYKQIVAYPERLTSGDYATAIKLVRHFCKSAPASTVLTDERILNIWADVRVKHETGCAFNFARAIEREVAAQASQVAVPKGWVVEKYDDPHYGNAVRIHGPCGFATVREGSCDPTESVLYRYFTAPSAPAVAQQAPAAEVPLWDENGEPWNLAAEQVEYERAQASTAGERPEQQS